MTRSSVPDRLAPALLLAVSLLASGCSRLAGEGRLAEAEAGPGSGQAARLLRMADDAAAAGDPATAANLYGRVLAVEPNNREAARRLGEALSRAGRWQDAIDAFRRVLAADPGEPEASRGTARALLALGRPDAALARLEEALARAPDDPRLVNAKGVALDQLGRHEEAQAVYRAALARWPENASLRNNLGLSLALSGRYDEAIGELGALARGPQDSPRARHNLAAAYALKGDLRAAESLLRLDLDDKDLRSTLAYYTALRGLGSPRAARGLLPDGATRGAPAPEPPRPPVSRAPVRAADGPPAEATAAALGEPGGRARLRAPESEPAVALAAGPGSGPAAPPGEAPWPRRSVVASPPALAESDPPGASPVPAATSITDPAPVVLAAATEPAVATTEEASPADAATEGVSARPIEAVRTPSATTVEAVERRPVSDGDPVGGAAAPSPAAPAATLPGAPPSARAPLPALPVEPARGGDWVVELGRVANGEEGRARWQALRRAHAEALGGVARLGDEQGGGGPLLAGPFVDREAAERACARLASDTECRVTRL